MGASCSACDAQARQLLRSVQSGDCITAVAVLHRAPTALTCTKGLSARTNVWHCAAKAGKAQVIEALIHFSLSAESPFGHLEPDERLSKLQAMLNVQNAKALSPLMLACIHGHAEAAAVLARAGADPFLLDRSGATAVLLAARNGHADCIRAVLSNINPELNRNARHRIEDRHSITGVTPLHAAAACNRPECVEVLLQYNAQTMPRVRLTGSMAAPAAPGPGGLDERTFTTELGLPAFSGSTPLHLAADRGHMEVVQAILRFQAVRYAGRTGARVDPRWARDAEGLSPLQVATRRRHPAELLELLHPLTDLVATFGVQNLAAPGQVGVPKLSVIAAAAHQAKLLSDVQQASHDIYARKSAGTYQQPAGAQLTREDCGGNTKLTENSKETAPTASSVCTAPCSAFPDGSTCIGQAGPQSSGCCPTPAVQASGQPAAPSTSGSNPLTFAQDKQRSAPQPTTFGAGPTDGEGSDDIDGLCALCYERAPEIQAAGCSHRLCCTCAESLCGQFTNKPILCPFCRSSIGAFCGVEEEA